MSFNENVYKLAEQIQERKKHISNEEMTKHSLIIPFIQLLGFDVFNPLEVQPEYTADFGKKKGEKVDYAILKNNKILIFVEAKPVGSRLDTHNAQLSRYFNSTPEVKLAIITDGVKYNFFSDVKQPNIMDTIPFFEMDFSAISEADVQVLSQFQKDCLDNGSITKLAEDLLSVIAMQKLLRDLFTEPSDEFIRFIARQTGQSRVTSVTLERYRPLIKKCMLSTLSEIFSDVSKEMLQPTAAQTLKGIRKPAVVNPITEPIIGTAPNIDTPSRQELTEVERRVFDRVSKLLQNGDPELTDIKYRLLENELVFTSSNRDFLKFKMDGHYHFISNLDTAIAAESCPYYEISEQNSQTMVTFNSVADIGNIKNFIIASLAAS